MPKITAKITQTTNIPIPRGGQRTHNINQSIISMLLNYLQKNKRGKAKTSPLEEYEMKRKEKDVSIHDISFTPLRESSALAFCVKEKPSDGVTSISTPHTLKRFLKCGTPSLNYFNTLILSKCYN